MSETRPLLEVRDLTVSFGGRDRGDAGAWLAAQLADPANYADAAKMARLGSERQSLAEQLEQAESVWMELLD